MSPERRRAKRAVATVAAALGVLITSGGAGLAQVAAPSAPARPPVPAGPVTPASPVDPTGATHRLSLALLGVNGPRRTVDGLLLDVAGSLRLGGGSGDVQPLALALVHGLRGRDVPAELRQRIAGSVVDALGAQDLGRALDEVRAALAAAGLGAPDIVLVETELRRLGRRTR
jgi:hypothetical protein